VIERANPTRDHRRIDRSAAECGRQPWLDRDSRLRLGPLLHFDVLPGVRLLLQVVANRIGRRILWFEDPEDGHSVVRPRGVGPLPVCSLLIVEDHDDTRETLAQLVESEGHLHHEVSNGADALAWLEEQQDMPCLVLLDLRMPVMDGWEFLPVLRAVARLSWTTRGTSTAPPGCRCSSRAPAKTT